MANKYSLKKTRVFGGKRYSYASTSSSKVGANKKAKELRSKGRNARIVAFKNLQGGTNYAIYTSAKKRQGYNARMDESLGMRRGASRTKRQSMKSRRDESKGMSKSMGRRAYASVRSMDKGRRTRR